MPKTSRSYGESAVVRIRTADHPINSRGLYRTELRRPACPYRRGVQIVSQEKSQELTESANMVNPGQTHPPVNMMMLKFLKEIQAYVCVATLT